jgi:hypothetical protein
MTFPGPRLVAKPENALRVVLLELTKQTGFGEGAGETITAWIKLKRWQIELGEAEGLGGNFVERFEEQFPLLFELHVLFAKFEEFACGLLTHSVPPDRMFPCSQG